MPACTTGIWGCVLTLAGKYPIKNEEMSENRWVKEWMVKIAQSTPKLYKQPLHSLRSAIANDSLVQTLPVQSKAQLALYSVSYSEQ